MVGDQNDEIRSALADVLEDDGYAVIEADSLAEASAIIDAAATSLILVSGNAGTGDHGLECFTAVAADPATHQAYMYVSSTPPGGQLPALVYGLAQVGASPPHKSFEMVSLLVVVAAAAARVRAG
jgi:CheY-like chemotaxis protein